MVDAVILAGSSNSGPLSKYSPVPYESLIPVGDRPMVEYVYNALAGSGQVGRVVVAGPVEEMKACLKGGNITFISPRDTIMTAMREGFSNLGGTARVLVVTADIPLLTPEAVGAFLNACGDMEADIYYPVVPQKLVEKSYPGGKRTYVALREGAFTGGNIFLINPSVMDRCWDMGQSLIDARKSPVKLSRLVGFAFLVRFLLHAVSLAEAERTVSRVLGVKGRVVVVKYPEIGFDVDKPSDLVLARQVIGGGKPIVTL